MTIATGARLPEATLLEMGADGPEEVALAPLLTGRKVAIFGMPGAFTGTCTGAHIPSLIRTYAGFAKKGVNDVLVIVVNDPFVCGVWAEQTGAKTAGIRVLGDPKSDFTAAIGMAFDAPPVGFYGRCKRFSMLVEDGVVSTLNEEVALGSCDLSSGETLLEAL